MQDLRDACERVGFPLPATAQQAETYLIAIAGLCLFRSEGIPGGAAGWRDYRLQLHHRPELRRNR